MVPEAPGAPAEPTSTYRTLDALTSDELTFAARPPAPPTPPYEGASPPRPPAPPTATTCTSPAPAGTANVSSPAVVYVHELDDPSVQKMPLAPQVAAATGLACAALGSTPTAATVTPPTIARRRMATADIH